MPNFSCFKSYDVRGKLGDELNESIAYRIGRAFAQHLNAQSIVVGSDIRLSSESLKQALSQGIMDSGCNVIDLGLTGTEEIYFAGFHLPVDGGVQITASHNPIDYNGMKFIGRLASPISSNNGLKVVKKLAEDNNFVSATKVGELRNLSLLDEYIAHILDYIELATIRPLKIVVNAGNGAAGHVIDEIEAVLNRDKERFTFIKIHHEPDGSFPNGIPNPLLPENRSATSDAVKQHKAHMGIAWDGDFDRCFFFDEKGQFIEGYYIVGLLAEAFLKKSKGEKIIHDPRLTWNTIDLVQENEGIPIISKTGHAFIKEKMREEDAVYGGEMSSHHYFRDFAYCDSGMIPWLLIAELMCLNNKPLSQLVGERILKYPCSGEINYTVSNPVALIESVKLAFSNDEDLQTIDEIDGLSMSFEDWRFNLRYSNTEPLLRLNVESSLDASKVQDCVALIESILC